MSRRSRNRQVEIFNFSFLDILACTIALLIFIMVMVFVLQSGSPVADPAEIVSHTSSEALELVSATDRDIQIAENLESALGKLKIPGEPDLAAKLEAATKARESARSLYEEARRAQQEVQNKLDTTNQQRISVELEDKERANSELLAAITRQKQAEKDLEAVVNVAKQGSLKLLPRERPGDGGGQFDVLHIDCHDHYLALLKLNGDHLVEVGRTEKNDLTDANSDFRRLVSAHRQKKNAMVLFWIRPDGASMCDAALDNLPKPMRYGFEPADASWTFASGAK